MRVRDSYSVEIRGGGPPIGPGDLDVCERRLGVRFPPAYRDLLLRHNGGKPTPACFLMRGFAPEIETLLAIDPRSSADEVEATCLRLRFENGLDAEFVPIARVKGGCVLLVRSGDADGRLSYWIDIDDGFRRNDPDYVNMLEVYFPVADLLRKLGPARGREDIDGLFVQLYQAAHRPAQGVKFVRRLVEAGYDLNFVLEGYRHPIFAAIEGDAFAVARALAEGGARPNHRDFLHEDATAVDRLHPSLSWWRVLLDEDGSNDAVRAMAARRVDAIEAAIAAFAAL